VIKTGEVYDLDPDGVLVLCESWQDEETGEVTTTRTRQEPVESENG
jgi:hypothetical protein